MAKRKNLRPQRFCIFCLGGRSKEHLFSGWMHVLLPDSPEGFIIQRAANRDPYRTHRKGQGSIKNQTINIVCKVCNSRWMSAIENRARPILTPMIKGSPILLSEAQLHILARWFALKALIVGHDDPVDAVSLWEDRRDFCEKEVMPRGMTIRLAACGKGRWVCGSFRLSVHAASSPPPPGTRKNVQTVTLGIGDVLAHVAISLPGAPDPEDFASVNENLLMLWPAPKGPVWWPSVRLSEAAATELSLQLDRLPWHPSSFPG